MSHSVKAVLFDIDGTLMRAGGAGREALVRAAAKRFAAPLGEARDAIAGIDFRGATDVRIFSEVQRLVGNGECSGNGWDGLVTAYLAELDGCLDEAEIEVMPGVETLLATLEERPHHHLGLLTGNIRAGAERKLARVGLQHLVKRPGGFGEDGARRSDLTRAAAIRLGALGVTPAATLIIGDTERDVSAAHAIGAAAVAVATGWTEREALEGCGAQLVLDDLSDTASVLALLDSLEP